MMKEKFYISGIAFLLAFFCFYACKDSDEPTLEVKVVSDELIEFEGGTVAVEVKSNSAWTVSVSEAWATTSVTEGKNNASFNVTATQNENEKSRTVTVTVKVSGALQKSVTITQAGKVPETLEIEMASNDPVPYEGGTFRVNVRSNTKWKISTSDKWVTVGVMGGENDGSFDFTVSMNESEDDRKATVTVQTETKKIIETINITQKGVEPFKMEQLYGTWWVSAGSVIMNGQLLTDPMIDIQIRSLTIEEYDEGVILIRDLGAINYWFQAHFQDHNDYSLATVDEENRTIRIHHLVELDPLYPDEPDVKFTCYFPLYDIIDRASNAFKEFPPMKITGVPGYFSIDMGFGYEMPINDIPTKCSFLLGDMLEKDGVLEYGYAWVAYIGTVISQQKPPIEEENP